MIRGALLLVALVAVVSGALWVGQRGLIYFPDKTPVSSSGVLGRGVIDARIVTEDGVALGGWFLPAPGATGRAVIVFNGNAGSRAQRVPLAVGLASRGWSVLLFDYRGYGGNAGRPSEDGLLHDARAARDWLTARPGVDGTRIVYLGESLGAAVALALAVERPPQALVLRSPFTSLVDVGRLHYPWLPVGWMLRDRYPSLERIRAVERPLLVVAGSEDSIVPETQSRTLFEASPSAVKRFVGLPGADHNDPRLTAGDEILDRVAEFLGALG